MARIASAGDGLVMGEGDVLGAMFFEDSPIPGEITEVDKSLDSIIVLEAKPTMAQLFSAETVKAQLEGVK